MQRPFQFFQLPHRACKQIKRQLKSSWQWAPTGSSTRSSSRCLYSTIILIDPPPSGDTSLLSMTSATEVIGPHHELIPIPNDRFKNFPLAATNETSLCFGRICLCNQSVLWHHSTCETPRPHSKQPAIELLWDEQWACLTFVQYTAEDKIDHHSPPWKLVCYFFSLQLSQPLANQLMWLHFSILIGLQKFSGPQILVVLLKTSKHRLLVQTLLLP